VTNAGDLLDQAPFEREHVDRRRDVLPRPLVQGVGGERRLPVGADRDRSRLEAVLVRRKLAILSRPCHHLGHGGIEKTASSARSAAIVSTSRRDQASM
jgi:hypothetical protein